MENRGDGTKLNDRRIAGKLDKLMAEAAKPKANESVEMMKARNSIIRERKNLAARGEKKDG